MNIGDRVQRIKGSYLGMDKGDYDTVTGVSAENVELAGRSGWHDKSNLIVVRPEKQEQDPLGKDAHQPGAKLDAGKSRPALVLGGFARALAEVSRVGTYGATKYTDNGWMEVPNGVARYSDALIRHQLAEQAGQELDPDTKLLHAAHAAWNALARLDLILREKENNE